MRLCFSYKGLYVYGSLYNYRHIYFIAIYKGVFVVHVYSCCVYMYIFYMYMYIYCILKTYMPTGIGTEPIQIILLNDATVRISACHIGQAPTFS